MHDVSIEYAHIYTNKQIDEEQKLSVEILKSVQSDLQKTNQSLCYTIMIDDYSFPDSSFDYDGFTTWLSESGFKPDVTIRESQLIPLCEEVLELLDDQKLKAELSEYIRDKKYPCSLFIAAWYLMRLGYLNGAIFDPKFTAKRLLNILPQSFKPFEDKALKIIEATSFPHAKEQIQYEFFEGRAI